MIIKLISSIINLCITLVLLPLRMLAKNFVGTVILFGVLFFFFWPKNNTTQPIQAPQQRVVGKNKQPIPIIQPVKKTQDGNSKFSDDLLSQMTPQELKFYSDTFFWVMNNKKSGYPHRWAHYNIDGTITPFGVFKNNHGHSCRKFKETLKVHSTRQTLDGLACERPEGGWCRLRFDSTPLCDIGENGPGLFQGISNKLNNLF